MTAMIEQKFGPRRCKDTRKPLEKQCPDVIFYRCPECGALYPVTGGTNLEEKEILCCGKKAERLVPGEADSVRDVMDITYQITGGYNDNAVRVSWKMKPYGRHPEWIYLKTRMVKKYYFERKRGMWMLEAINLRHIEEGEGENFVDFYTRFVTDSLYQSEHIANPLQFVTIDPDDEFAILETTLDVNQWYAFRPSLPADKLSNINYGQKNEDNSNTKILKVNGIGNGYSNVFYFRRRGGEWKMYKYEDTSI